MHRIANHQQGRDVHGENVVVLGGKLFFGGPEKSCTCATYHVFSFKFRCVPILRTK